MKWFRKAKKIHRQSEEIVKANEKKLQIAKNVY